MIAPHRRIVALVPLASPASAGQSFGSSTLLAHTLLRLSRCKRLDAILLIQPTGDPAPAIPADSALAQLLTIHRTNLPLTDANTAIRRAARAWSPTAWRGGLGGATCYDEFLCAGPMLEAIDAASASAALLVAPDWALVDPAICDAVIDRHLSNTDALRLVFTQAPPGLAGCLIDRGLLAELRDNGGTIGSILEYNPRIPQGDPIGKDPCVLIPPEVRNFPSRATGDAPRYLRALRTIEHRADLLTLDAAAIMKLLPAPISALPQQVTLEINTTRNTSGPAVPLLPPLTPGEGRGEGSPEVRQTQDLSLDTAKNIFRDLAAEPDTAITLAGLGDPLFHPHWDAIILAAREAGIGAIHVQTDLLVDVSVLQRILELPIDVLSVNIHADTAATYQAMMGRDGFKQVLTNIEWLLNHRGRASRPGLPWIAPRFVKTAANVHELESFFDRWFYFCGHAIVESPAPADGAVAASPVLDMAPPRRRPCRQLSNRMTIHCDGSLALCDQDSRGRAALGTAAEQPIAQLWQSLDTIRAAHTQQNFTHAPLCATCREWHRP